MKNTADQIETADLKEAMLQRLIAVYPFIADEKLAAQTVEEIPRIIRNLAFKVRTSQRLEKAWLFLVALSGRFPHSEDVREFFGRLNSSYHSGLFLASIKGALIPAYTGKSINSSLEIVSNSIVVDVNFCATNGHNTGIQRVVRETVSRWSNKSNVILAAWTPDATGMRRLTRSEQLRVVEWTSAKRQEHTLPEEVDSKNLIVPWNSAVIMPEVISETTCKPWASMAEFSGNFTGVIGYDAIPVTSSDAVPPHESDRFVHYLSAVKYANKVAGISHSASNEFLGFNKMLSAQGLSGPSVKTCSLATQRVDAATNSSSDISRPTLPIVLSVGTQEPRKNQLSTIAAAELLWKEGLKFELVFVGHAAVPLSDPFDNAVKFAREIHKRPIRVLRNASDSELGELYDKATFSVFVSLHEGYGLPVVESLAHGCPVIASNYGSVGEVASTSGGCLLVDPRNVTSIADAMREMITSEVLRESLSEEARNRKEKTWDEFSQELWNYFELSGSHYD